MTIKDIKKQDGGTTVNSVTGTISDVGERKSGQGKKGPWTLQNFKLTQDGEFIYVTLWNSDELSGCANNTWTFQGDGIKIVDKTGKNGKTYKNLEISKINPVKPEEASNPAPASQPSNSAQKTEPVDAEGAAVTAQGEAAKLMLMALEVAFQVQNSVGPDVMSNEDAHTWARQCIINWERSGKGSTMASAWTYEEAVERFKRLGVGNESQPPF